MARKQMMGDGFSEGSHGRGPMPYKKSHSVKPDGHSASLFGGKSGRGTAAGSGIHPGGEVVHPQSHGAWEGMGCNKSDGE